MKKTLYSLLMIIALTTGCSGNFLPDSGEITSYEIVRVLGIDSSTSQPGGVEVTMIAERAKPSPGEEGGGVSYELMSESGDTAFEAVTKIRSASDKKQVFGYVDYILFGENTSHEDFTKYADFPARNPEIRFSPKVFMVRAGTAKDLLEKTSSGDIYIGDSLDNLSGNVNIRSDFGLVKNIEVMNMLDDKESAVVIPAIEAQSEKNRTMIDGELPEKRMGAAGYAVICGNKLAGYFEPENARGYNFLTGGVRTSAYSIPDDSGSYVGLDVLCGKMKLDAQWQGKQLEGVKCSLRVDANVAEQRSLADINGYSQTERLAARLAEAIESELNQTIALSQEFGMDCFGIGKKLELKHPYKWAGIAETWGEAYAKLPIQTDVDVIIRRVYDLREPSGSGSRCTI